LALLLVLHVRHHQRHHRPNALLLLARLLSERDDEMQLA
jgi:hypothetical protein